MTLNHSEVFGSTQDSSFHTFDSTNRNSYTGNSSSVWSEISAQITRESIEQKPTQKGTLNLPEILNEKPHQWKVLVGPGDDPPPKRPTAHDDPSDPRPYWRIDEDENCAFQRNIEKNAHLPNGSFGIFSTCTWNPEALHKVPAPVDKDGDPLFATSTAQEEFPKLSELMRKALGNPEKNSVKFFDAIAEERLLLTNKEFQALLKSLNEKVAEWKPDRRFLMDGTWLKGDDKVGSSYWQDANGSFKAKSWGSPEETYEKVRTADGSARGYQEVFKTEDPKGKSYALRFNNDYSWSILYSNGDSQIKDKDGHVTHRWSTK